MLHSAFRISHSASRILHSAFFILALAAGAQAANVFRVTPYVQHVTTNAVSLLWLAQETGAATVSWWPEGRPGEARQATTEGREATELNYDGDGSHSPQYLPYTVPWQHAVRLTGLEPDSRYCYSVTLAGEGGASYANAFRTAPARFRPVRFVCYSDCETEPESTGSAVTWDDLRRDHDTNPSATSRKYYVDQTIGYASNICTMAARNPDFIVIAGDLAQTGSKQTHWDEFWRHNAGELNDPAGSTPIVAAIGNHEYSSYQDLNGERGPLKYLSYFEFEPNGAAVLADQQERFHRFDYGPVTLLFIDPNNGPDRNPSNTWQQEYGNPHPEDTNAQLREATSHAPDFREGSVQYQWLEEQLADAQTNALFTFVVCHQCPFSAGYHGRAPGEMGRGTEGETLSGVPTRCLTNLLFRYGCDGWICGHDEMYEHSQVHGEETLPDGTRRPVTLNVYDVGMGGDGLRGCRITTDPNPWEVFRAHVDAPEVYDENGILVSGGKHYGHLEINVEPNAEGLWQATLTPAYVFVTTNAAGQACGFERRTYADEIVLTNTLFRAVATTNVYTGANNGDWFVEANWSLGRVPTADDAAVIDGKTVNATNAIVAASLSLSSATLNLGGDAAHSNVVASATLSGDLTLTGASKLYVNAGELPASEWSVFADDATAVAALYAAANTVTVGGAFSVGDTSVVYPAAAVLTGVPVVFRVGTFTLAEGASFNAKKRGWGWAKGAFADAPDYAKPGKHEGPVDTTIWTLAIGSGLNYDVGGSYGGLGGGATPSTYSPSGLGTFVYAKTYCSQYAPFMPGSPAGAYKGVQNARGPGSVVVLATGAATIDGTIDVSGVPHSSGYSYDHSGASGGGVWLVASSFSFGANASFDAHGESTTSLYYAPGGGGRVAVCEGLSAAELAALVSGMLPGGVFSVPLSAVGIAANVAGGTRPGTGTQGKAGTTAYVARYSGVTHGARLWTDYVGNHDWFEKMNWYPPLVPTDEDDVYATNATIVVTNAVCVRSLTIAGASSLDVSARPAPAGSDAASLYVASTAFTVLNRLEIGGTTVVTLRNDPVTGAAVKMLCGDFALGPDATLDANAGGWAWYESSDDAYAVSTAGAYQTRAPGRGRSYDFGAGHGAVGGNNSLGGTYGQPYGEKYAPFLPGSPNGLYQNNLSNGGAGGGTVWVVCTNLCEIEGTITANGGRKSMYGGTSGGGVWLAARGFSAGTSASASAAGGLLTGGYASYGAGGRIALSIGLTSSQLDALAAGETPAGVDLADGIDLFATDVRGSYRSAAPAGYGSNGGTTATARGPMAFTTVAVQSGGALFRGVDPGYGFRSFAPGTTATFTAPEYGVADGGAIRHPCVGYIVSNATAAVTSGSGRTVEIPIGSDPLSVTWLWSEPEYLSIVRKPANGTLLADGATQDGDIVVWSAGELPAVSVTPGSGYAFVCWEGNIPLGKAWDNPLSLPSGVAYDLTPVLRLDEAATTRTWNGTGLWTDASKWSPAGNIPGPDDAVVVESGTCVVSNALAAASLRVAGGTLAVGRAGDVNPEVAVAGGAALSGGTLSLGSEPGMAGHGRLAVAGDLALSGTASLQVFGGPVAGEFTFASGCSFVDVGGALTLDDTATLGLHSDYLTGGSVKVSAESVAIGASASVEADQKGYMWQDTTTPPAAPGLGYDYNYGASHGGEGGRADGNYIAPTYGQRLAPVEPGSPDGCYASTYGYIRRGGGLVRIHASGTIALDGAVSADASQQDTGGTDYGGASGGGIWLTARDFAFGPAASLTARGGHSDYISNGGGGRIALGYQLTEAQIAALAATGAAGLPEGRELDEAAFRERFGNATMAIGVGSAVKDGKNQDHPGTFVFLDGKKYRSLILLR